MVEVKKLLRLQQKMKRMGLKPSWVCRTYVGDEYKTSKIKILIIGRYTPKWAFATSKHYIDLVRWRKVRSTFWSFVESITERILGNYDPLPQVAWTNILKIAGNRHCSNQMINMQKELALQSLCADLKRLKPNAIILPTNDFMGGIVNQALKEVYHLEEPLWAEESPGLWHTTIMNKNKPLQIFITKIPQGWKKKYADIAKDTIIRIVQN